MTWVREALAPRTRERSSEAEIEEARKAAAEKGQLSIFETLPEVEETDKAASTQWKKKHDHVCVFVLVSSVWWLMRIFIKCSSINIPLQTSKSLTES